MPKTLSHILRNRLTRSAYFHRLLQDLQVIFGVECLYLDDLGAEKIRYPRTHQNPMHKLESLHPPLQKLKQQARQARISNAEEIDSIPWIEIHHAMTIQQETIGYLVLSAWRPDHGDIDSIKEFWIEAARQGNVVSWENWRNTWNQLPVCTTHQQPALSRALRLFANEALSHAEAENLSTPATQKLPPVVQAACSVIRENYTLPLTLKGVAKQCQVSPEHLSRLFHQSTGIRFREYVAETRVKAICDLLSSTPKPISEIAMETGFSTLSRFNRVFRESTGMTPRKWRKHSVLKTHSGMRPGGTSSQKRS